MYRQIPWELVADPLGFAERTLGTTGPENFSWFFVINSRTFFRNVR